MGKLLITGASGNVGRYVASYAVKNGEKIVLASTNPEKLKKIYGSQAEYVFFDFTKSETFVSALHDVDRIFLMRPPHLGRPQDLKPFIDTMQTGSIRMITFLSLIGIEKNPIPPHHKIEAYIEASGIPYCHLRPSFFMQNLSDVHDFEIREFNRIVVPVGHALTSFIDAEDIGELAARILSEPKLHEKRAYSLTGPEAIDYDEVAAILTEVLGRTIVYTKSSPMLAENYWIKIQGLDKEYAKVMSMLYLMTRLGTAKRITGDFFEIMNRPPHSFREFARKNRTAWEK